MVDEAYFRSFNEFKTGWEALAAEGDEGDPANPLEDDFLEMCYERACYTARGFKKWVYGVYPKIIGSLSD